MAGASRVYLDWNASAPLRAEAREAMATAFDLFGNPSSPHQEGRAARAAIETAREQVADLVGARPGEVAFTSGATEAINWALKSRAWTALRVVEGEHAAARAAALAVSETQGASAFFQPLNPAGDFDAAGAETLGSPSLCIGWEAQGETGAAAAPGVVAEMAKRAGAMSFTDATQLAGKAAFGRSGRRRVYRFDTDFAVVSAHKFGGPKGVGALLIREGVDAQPLIHGGGQELRRRSGTENLLGIIGMGAAAEAASRDLAASVWEHVRDLRDGLQTALLEATPGLQVVADGAPWRLANTLTVAAPGAKAESLLIRLDMAGIAVSAGSACSSGKMSASPVLTAMGLPIEIADAAIRVSLGPATTEAEIDAFSAAWRGLRLVA